MSGSAGAFKRGLEQFQLALEMDPNFAQARAMVAQSYLTQATLGGGVPLVEGLALCEAEARAALRLDQQNAMAHAQLARVLDNRGDWSSALQQVERAIAFSPNEPGAHMTRGHLLVFAHRPDEGRAALNMTLRLDPLGETVPQVLGQLTMSYYLEREYAAAEAEARRLIHTYPGLPRTYPFLAASLAQLGRIEEAQMALHQTIAEAPGYCDLLVHARPPWYRPDDYQHVLDGLRKAGWKD